MNTDSKHLDLNLQEATIHDIPTLTKHHCEMFVEIWENNDESITVETLNEIEKSYADKLKKQLGDGSCTVWIVKNYNEIVASGGITVCSFVPTPIAPSSEIAFFHSLYTEKMYRKNNCANLIMEKAIQHCKDIGINRILLTASNAGRPIYEKIGFEAVEDMMRMVIEES